MKITARTSSTQVPASKVAPHPALAVELLRKLDTNGAPRPGGEPHLAAASTRPLAGDRLLIPADDESSLGVFPAQGRGAGKWFPLFDEVLPADEAARKAVKRDIESLTLLPSSSAQPGRAVLAVGSGSKATRNWAVAVALSENGQPIGRPRHIDLAALYGAIGAQVKDLNIEGAVVMGQSLRLLQRGNGAAGINAFIDVDLAAVTTLAHTGGALPASALMRIQRVELGQLNGVPLGLTDASPLPDGRMVFAAAAEDSQSTYHDGVCTGSAVGIADASGKVLALFPLEGAAKIEGIQVEHVANGRVQVLLVADGDDPHKPAPLMRTSFPLI